MARGDAFPCFSRRSRRDRDRTSPDTGSPLVGQRAHHLQFSIYIIRCSNGTRRKQTVTRSSMRSPLKKPAQPSLTRPVLTARISTIRLRKRDDATAMKNLSESSVRDWRTEKKRRAIKKRKIDYSDIPPLSDRQLASMRRVGRPPLGEERRQLIAIRLDPTVLRWLKSLAVKREIPYQSLINDLLAGEMKKAS